MRAQLSSAAGLRPFTFLAAALVLMLSLHVTPPTARADSGESFAVLDVLTRINAIRATNGLPAVALSDQLMGIAAGRSADMIARSYFSHVFPGCGAGDGRWSVAVPTRPCNFLGLLDQRSVSYSWAGEILEWNLFLTAYDQATADRMAVDDFMNSPHHRAILLDQRFASAGIGVGIGGNKRMVLTVIFTAPYAA